MHNNLSIGLTIRRSKLIILYLSIAYRIPIYGFANVLTKEILKSVEKEAIAQGWSGQPEDKG
jgi:hypothetical protein